MSKRDYIGNMKSSGVENKNPGFYIERLFKITEDLNRTSSIDELIVVRDKYLVWYAEMREFFDKSEEYLSIAIYLPDKVQQSFFEEGGVGFLWGDERSQLVTSQIKEEIKNKTDILGKITPYTQWNKIIQKSGDTFNYLGKPISIGKNTVYYHLLDILFSLSDQDGFLSYSKIISEMKKRLRKGLLQDSIQEILKKTISNARDNLFSYSKINEERFLNKTPNGKEIIEVVRKKGLKINNEEV